MKYELKSAFAPYIAGLVEQKHADGFSYHSQEKLLKRFDTFCAERFPNATVITRDIVAEWSVIGPTEGRGFRDGRMGAAHQLGLYMLSLGLDAYIPRNYSKKERPILYVPTREEMTAFFKEMDVWQSPQPRLQRFIVECKMMYLLYYCCGMRLSEARFLKKEHVDRENGVLAIYESKGHKDRLVYLPKDGIGVFRKYLRDIEKIIPNTPWVFPGNTPDKPISYNPVENRFNECWSRLPFAANTNKHPTPHCLRHAFVVERLNEWMLQGIDTQKMLVHLSKYLGHTSPQETHYYYHLVQKAFAIIKEKDTVSRRVIPEVIPYENYEI
jgi:integrase